MTTLEATRSAPAPAYVADPSMDESVVLQVKHLKKYFPIERGFWRHTVGVVRAVGDVNFAIRQGETVSLVGESGCGKTTTARCIVRAMAPTSGEILYRTHDGNVVDLAAMSMDEIRPLRRGIQMVFQDPFSSLNPRMTIFDIVSEPLRVNNIGNRSERQDRVAELLRKVGLRAEYMQRFPHAFSGGQRQRVGIARALAANPRLIVADEPVSALDVSVQAQVLNLMMDLQDELGLTYLFVSHDLSVVNQISSLVVVMYVGRVVEVAPPQT
jgi:peptide/nickel transport system ATP-binding protein